MLQHGKHQVKLFEMHSYRLVCYFSYESLSVVSCVSPHENYSSCTVNSVVIIKLMKLHCHLLFW